ncbi:hypothetical protein BU17DRAFT_60402 [Hysterangium stoloniferum]|nr:hypothetical protein BU17DRAFT_60402 [Hysterangium stoloniferum]
MPPKSKSCLGQPTSDAPVGNTSKDVICNDMDGIEEIGEEMTKNKNKTRDIDRIPTLLLLRYVINHKRFWTPLDLIIPWHIRYRVIFAKLSDIGLWEHIASRRDLASRVHILDITTGEHSVYPPGHDSLESDFVSPLGFPNTLEQIVPSHVREMCFHDFGVPNERLQIFHLSFLTQLSIMVGSWEPRPDFDENLLTILRLTPRLRDLCIEISYCLAATLREVHLPELLRLTLHGVGTWPSRQSIIGDESQDIMFNFFRRHNELTSLSLKGPLVSPGNFHPNSLPCLTSLSIRPFGTGIEFLPVGFGKQLRHLELTTTLGSKRCSLLSHMTELVILKVSIKRYSSLMELRVLPNLQVLDLTCIRRERHDVDQFFGQLYKFPNLRYLYLFADLLRLPDASIIRKKVTTILSILEGLSVQFYDDENDFYEEGKIIEIRRVHDPNMRGYTTVERRGGDSGNDTRPSFEMWTGMKYSDDFYYGGLRHR